MSEPSSAGTRLAVRLRELRTQTWPGVTVTQKQIAEALGGSVPLVSSWESLRVPALPSEDRLHGYARFFATQGPLAVELARLVDEDQLTEQEETRRQQLLDELLGLRDEAIGGQRSSGVRSFWHFPDGQPVCIVAPQLPQHEIKSQYASKWHPNYIAGLRNADVDATIELYGHIRAENPTNEVTFLTADAVDANVFSSHVVFLGDASFRQEAQGPSLLDYYVKRLELPVYTTLPEQGDPEYDSVFVVTSDDRGRPRYRGPHETIYAPRFIVNEETGERLVSGGHPELEYDVALISRLPNPLKLTTTVSICCGVFSRGTYGAVRALTDPRLRALNETFVRTRLDPDRFWLLTYVPVFKASDGFETLTPDLNRPMHVLTSSSSPSSP